MNDQRGNWNVWEKVNGSWQLRGSYTSLLDANRVLKECRADGHQAVRVENNDPRDRKIRADLHCDL